MKMDVHVGKGGSWWRQRLATSLVFVFFVRWCACRVRWCVLLVAVRCAMVPSQKTARWTQVRCLGFSRDAFSSCTSQALLFRPRDWILSHSCTCRDRCHREWITPPPPNRVGFAHPLRWQTSLTPFPPKNPWQKPKAISFVLDNCERPLFRSTTLHPYILALCAYFVLKVEQTWVGKRNLSQLTMPSQRLSRKWKRTLRNNTLSTVKIHSSVPWRPWCGKGGKNPVHPSCNRQIYVLHAHLVLQVWQMETCCAASHFPLHYATLTSCSSRRGCTRSTAPPPCASSLMDSCTCVWGCTPRPPRRSKLHSSLGAPDTRCRTE